MEKQLSFFKTKPKNKINICEIYTDGASRGNPGQGGAGIYILYNKNIILRKSFYLGKVTNNQAEYLAFAIAVYFLTQKIKLISNINVIFYADSELLIKQMKKIYRIKNIELKKIKTFIDAYLPKRNIKFKHVVRENNTIADKLANVGIDKKVFIPEEIKKSFLKYNIKIK